MANLTKTVRKLAAAALLIVGGFLCVQASWLPAKAWLSQQLIKHSWQQSISIMAQQKIRGQDNTNPHSLSKPIAIKPWPWADTFPIAELVFQRIDKSIVVLNGGDPTTLAFSAGAVAPFNQPAAIKPFVVAGHRDSHFAFLEDIAIKDIVSLVDARGKMQHYQVESIDIVDATIGQFPLVADERSLVLITCYPFKGITNSADERYVITAPPL
ncbi:class GN sortase [Colwellia sp. Arc7-D]|uniref:class GN sortase n=1 Tax=Colwellia sp. Arc7-D TaxID=2161872 RepID=UPI000D3650DD|nr:class GN sortase [Colwellia sp. Arc7-D]AWB58508.1 class GN sortase [Colwellia sp. Arc7-D]